MSTSLSPEIEEGVSTSGADTVGGATLVGVGVCGSRVVIGIRVGSSADGSTVGVFMIGDRVGMGDMPLLV